MATIASAEDVKAPAKFRVYIGTGTGKTAMGNESKGIYASELDLASGKLSEPVLVAECKGPSFLALHPDGKHLYAVGQMTEGGKNVGALSAFVIEDAKTGKLKMLNQASSGGPGPCHLVVDKAGKLVLGAGGAPLEGGARRQPARLRRSTPSAGRRRGRRGRSRTPSHERRFEVQWALAQ